MTRPRTLRSTTTKLATERGSLFVTVCVDDDGRPYEILGSLGKAGSPEHGMAETACRLISLHLRRGTPVDEIVGQCRGIGEMQPWPNLMPGGRTVQVRGIADGIAHVLREIAGSAGAEEEIEQVHAIAA